jgi:toxin ParE1/3/4
MARFRLSGPAQADVASIQATSLQRWGPDGRARYAALLFAALRTIAKDPKPPTSRDRAELVPGVRSLHLRHVRQKRGVKTPVHVVYYREIRAGLIEIVRVLHERMEPSRHLGDAEQAPRKRRR